MNWLRVLQSPQRRGAELVCCLLSAVLHDAIAGADIVQQEVAVRMNQLVANRDRRRMDTNSTVIAVRAFCSPSWPDVHILSGASGIRRICYRDCGASAGARDQHRNLATVRVPHGDESRPLDRTAHTPEIRLAYGHL